MGIFDGYARRGVPVREFPVVDGHCHIDAMANMEAPSLDDFVCEMDRVGIDVAAISSCMALCGDVSGGNDRTKAAALSYPGRFIAYCHVSSAFPGLMESELSRCFSHACFRGIKVYALATDYLDQSFGAVWDFAECRNVPVLCHTWAGELFGLDEVALKHPGAQFIVAHAGSSGSYEPYVSIARRCANVSLDTADPEEHTGMLECLVSDVGDDRLVFGSDAGCVSLPHQIGKVLFARISDDSKRKILAGNALRLFGDAPPLRRGK
jgi:uncharacterized protein